jgi:UDP-N-acetylglucosamine 2-epimerase (non-hydrolysing)
VKLTIVAGARPNFIKIAPILEAVNDKINQGVNISYRLVHTGQHYDEKMSGSFFKELNITMPNINLEVQGGTAIQQIAAIMVKFEGELIQNPSDLVLVVGDVNSTLACSLVAQKLGIKVAHVEGGIRSGDWNMPEEINRLVTDSITNYFFTTSIYANQNLRKSGVENEKIFFVGNTMIDTLNKNLPRLREPLFFEQCGLKVKDYFVLTLHRPQNVDEVATLNELLNAISINTRSKKIIFPVHPRTKGMLDQLSCETNTIMMVEPLGYLEFNFLVKNALAVLTDSGGITEEATVMGVPCITLRDTTERPETCVVGTNELVGTSPELIKKALEKLFEGNWKKGTIPEMWDGKAAMRIVEIICNNFT